MLVVVKSIHKSAILKWRIYYVDWLILKAYKGFNRLHFLRINKNWKWQLFLYFLSRYC